MDFGHAAEKFAEAKHLLTAPPARNPLETITHALHECELGLERVKDDDLDESAKTDLAILRRCMDTTGLEDPTGKRGLWAIKAGQMSFAEIAAFRSAVSGLAGWFTAKLEENGRQRHGR